MLDRQILTGEVPGPVHLPPGCPFARRCPIVREECSAKKPSPVDIGQGHLASCIRIVDGSNDIRNAVSERTGDIHGQFEQSFWENIMRTKGTIDIVVNVATPDLIRAGRAPSDDTFRDQVRQPKSVREGVTMAEYVKKMDRAGIERSLLIAVRAGDMRVKGSKEIPYKYVADICRKYPDRFSGLAGVDPMLGMQQLRDLEEAVDKYGFVGAHFYPHWFDMAPDHPYVFPIYAKCIELDIPIMMQVGHNLVYQRDRRLPSMAQPITLDRIAILYPELKLLGIHLGVPWIDEMISIAWKHENIYIGGDAYAPRYWPKQVVHYANTYGSHKFMFGTDWMVIDPERAVREVEELNFRPKSKAMVMRENAIRVFGLPKGGLKKKPGNWLAALDVPAKTKGKR